MNINSTTIKDNTTTVVPSSPRYLNGSNQVNVSEKLSESGQVNGSKKINDLQKSNETGEIKNRNNLQNAKKSNELKESQQNENNVVSKDEADDIVESLYELTEMLQTSLTFQTDEKSNEVVIKVIDKKTNEVIRQIPNEEIMQLREKMKEMTGILLSESV